MVTPSPAPSSIPDSDQRTRSDSLGAGGMCPSHISLWKSQSYRRSSQPQSQASTTKQSPHSLCPQLCSDSLGRSRYTLYTSDTHTHTHTHYTDIKSMIPLVYMLRMILNPVSLFKNYFAMEGQRLVSFTLV